VLFTDIRVFESRVLRRIFVPKRDEVTGKWRKLHNEELNDLYSSPNIVRKCTLVQALKLCTGRRAHRGSRGIALPFHDHGTRRG
jgi:hypothetical protein